MKRVVRKTAKRFFAVLDRLADPLTGPRLLIYHQIGGGSGLEMEVEPQSFRWQLDWVTANYSVVDLDTALDVGSDSAVVLTFDDGYRSLYEVAFPLLSERGLPFTLYLTTDPPESGRPLREHPGADPVTWEMVREMNDSGLMTVGAHTHTHPDLRGLNEDEIRKELEISDELIEARIGVRPQHFAYPWGYWSEISDGPVRQRYSSAALGSRLPRVHAADEQLVHRLPVQLSDGRRMFPSRVNRGLLYEEKVRRLVRGYDGP
jgi:peptidoglycan/xylan/chitin deacetylase (PgdA/CDA1 family)